MSTAAARALVPDAPWLEGPPPPVQDIGLERSRLLLPVPPALDRGLRYKALRGRYLFSQQLEGGAVLYARYAESWTLPADTDLGALTEALYGRALAARTGGGTLRRTTRPLPFGTTWVIEAEGPDGVCAGFFAPLRMGAQAPAGTWDAYLRGALCQGPEAEASAPWDRLYSLLRSAVFRE